MTNSGPKKLLTQWREAQRKSQGRSLKTQRDLALDATFGMLKGKGIFPDDALQFEREMREERK